MHTDWVERFLSKISSVNATVKPPKRSLVPLVLLERRGRRRSHRPRLGALAARKRLLGPRGAARARAGAARRERAAHLLREVAVRLTG